ncbi:XRE family transcriptional regulator [Shewanella sp. OPT22]|nr:XRE family transcriptional regulator [Shewanella sp. OPT22]
MILAEKIVRLRKQLGWSQEELAHKMDVSRQSVSKWESAHSIPDLNKILSLAEIFSVTTDFLLKDDNESFEVKTDSQSSDTTQITLEQALKYVESKLAVSVLNTKGAVLCICSAIPLFFFLAMAETHKLGITDDVAPAMGIVSVLLIVALSISFFVKTNQHDDDLEIIDNQKFELAYGVHSAIKEKLQQYRPTHNFRTVLGVFFFIISSTPLLLVSILLNDSQLTLLMLIVLLGMIATGVVIVAPSSAKFDAYNHILTEGGTKSPKSKQVQRAEKLAAFYWPLLTAIFLGWSFWTMDWDITWIIWPVGAVFFAALVGLTELLDKSE